MYLDTTNYETSYSCQIIWICRIVHIYLYIYIYISNHTHMSKQSFMLKRAHVTNHTNMSNNTHMGPLWAIWDPFGPIWDPYGPRDPHMWTLYVCPYGAPWAQGPQGPTWFPMGGPHMGPNIKNHCCRYLPQN
jgi:hypothetical protein